MTDRLQQIAQQMKAEQSAPFHTLDATQERILDDLRRANLRSPGSVKKRILNLLKRSSFSISQLADLRIEWRTLGLDKSPPPRVVSAFSERPVKPEAP